jgi:ATP-dependent Clp protease adaptor protein ClpS
MTVQSDTLTKILLKEPELFNVVILNDDKTPMEFVTGLLTELFNKTQQDAIDLMLSIHNNGSAVAGTYIFEIAEQKSVDATNLARDSGFPLAIKINAQ